MLTESGTFIHGIEHEGKFYREFVLEEEVMRHTFMVSNDNSLNLERLAGDEKKKIAPDAGYFSACIMAARLKVEGLDRVSPEQLEELSKADGMLLLVMSAQLEQRRTLFRAKAETPEKGHPSSKKTGLLNGGSPGDEQRSDQRV
jgi:hypothetical protein